MFYSQRGPGSLKQLKPEVRESKSTRKHNPSFIIGLSLQPSNFYKYLQASLTFGLTHVLKNNENQSLPDPFLFFQLNTMCFVVLFLINISFHIPVVRIQNACKMSPVSTAPERPNPAENILCIFLKISKIRI